VSFHGGSVFVHLNAGVKLSQAPQSKRAFALSVVGSKSALVKQH
jgi:hypothetical protein